MERKCWLKKFLKADAFIIALGGARGLTMPLSPSNKDHKSVAFKEFSIDFLNPLQKKN